MERDKLITEKVRNMKILIRNKLNLIRNKIKKVRKMTKLRGLRDALMIIIFVKMIVIESVLGT